MATASQIYTLEYVAIMLGEDPEMLAAIVSNEDNLTYGRIVTVCTGPDEILMALTGDGVDELGGMIAQARRSTDEWDQFLDDFVDDPDIITRVKAQTPRQQPGGYGRSPRSRNYPPPCQGGSGVIHTVHESRGT